MIRLALAAILVLAAAEAAAEPPDPRLDVVLDVPPVPLGKITRRAPYVPPPQAPAQALPADWRPTVRPAEDPAVPAAPGRLRYVPLPGRMSCSLDPAGREVCGPGYWFPTEERTP